MCRDLDVKPLAPPPPPRAPPSLQVNSSLSCYYKGRYREHPRAHLLVPSVSTAEFPETETAESWGLLRFWMATTRSPQWLKFEHRGVCPRSKCRQMWVHFLLVVKEPHGGDQTKAFLNICYYLEETLVIRAQNSHLIGWR